MNRESTNRVSTNRTQPTKTMVDKDEDSDLTKEIKERIRVDLEMRYLDPDI